MATVDVLRLGKGVAPVECCVHVKLGATRVWPHVTTQGSIAAPRKSGQRSIMMPLVLARELLGGLPPVRAVRAECGDCRKRDKDPGPS